MDEKLKALLEAIRNCEGVEGVEIPYNIVVNHIPPLVEYLEAMEKGEEW